MKRISGERGSSTALVIAVVMVSLLFVGVAVFGVWAFMGRQDYKDNVDSKIVSAVAANTKEVQAKDAADYAEAAKQPLKTYVGPDTYGSVHISYPKTWSAYVVTAGSSSLPLDMYAQPDVVPSITAVTSAFALRVQVTQTTYSQSLTQYQSLQKSGKVTVTPYALPKNSDVVGVRIDGQLTDTKQGSMIILPLRDKSLKLWTESNQYISDFNNIILPNASFSP
jgi:hypothetical protein